jgi:hypothetical protein
MYIILAACHLSCMSNKLIFLICTDSMPNFSCMDRLRAWQVKGSQVTDTMPQIFFFMSCSMITCSTCDVQVMRDIVVEV